MLKNSELLDKLSRLAMLIGEETSYDADTEIDEIVENSPEIQKCLYALAKVFIKITSRDIDADRLGELIIEAGIDTEFYEQHLADNQGE